MLVTFPVTRHAPDGSLKWSADMQLSNVSIAKKIDGQTITDADGTLSVNQDEARIEATAQVNGIPAEVTMFEPLGKNTAKREQSVTLQLDDKTRNALFPALDPLLSGPISVEIDKACRWVAGRYRRPDEGRNQTCTARLDQGSGRKSDRKILAPARWGQRQYPQP